MEKKRTHRVEYEFVMLKDHQRSDLKSFELIEKTEQRISIDNDLQLL